MEVEVGGRQQKHRAPVFQTDHLGHRINHLRTGRGTTPVGEELVEARRVGQQLWLLVG